MVLLAVLAELRAGRVIGSERARVAVAGVLPIERVALKRSHRGIVRAILKHRIAALGVAARRGLPVLHAGLTEQRRKSIAPDHPSGDQFVNRHPCHTPRSSPVGGCCELLAAQ